MAERPAINASLKPSSVSPIAVFTLMPVTTIRLCIDEDLGDREGRQGVAAPGLTGRDHRVILMCDPRAQGDRLAGTQRRDEAGVVNTSGAHRLWLDVVRDVDALPA